MSHPRDVGPGNASGDDAWEAEHDPEGEPEYIPEVPVPLPLLQAMAVMDDAILRILLFLLMHQYEQGVIGATATLAQISEGAGVVPPRTARNLRLLEQRQWVVAKSGGEWGLRT